MKKYLSFFLAITIIITSIVPSILLLSSATTSTDVGNISIENLKYAYGLRATENQVSVEYDSSTDGYKVVMPSNSKHVFMVSDTNVVEGTYTASFEYKIASTDQSASVGLILGASKNGSTIDLTTAYKLLVHKNKDLLRFSACDGTTPDLVGNNVSFDSGNQNVGVNYKENEWNTLSVTVNENGKVAVSVNGTELYSTTSTGYIDGYIGLYAYLPETQFRNFNLTTNNSPIQPEGNGIIDISQLDYAYGLRVTADQASVVYDSASEGYDINIPSNAKHLFLISNKASNDVDYTVSVEYQSSSTDANASIGIVLGASKDAGTNAINLKTAYKMLVYKNSDWLRFSACNGTTPDLVGNNVNFDSGNKKNIGVTYVADSWNKLSVAVTKEGKVSATVNGVEVYSTTATGYIDGYVGLYTYLAGTKFRNFKLETSEDEEEDTPTSSIKMTDLDFGYGLRATSDNVSANYDSSTEGYDISMPLNSKHIFLVSDKKSDGEGYTVSVEYQSSSTDANASIGIVLGASRDTATDAIDLTTAYKMLVYKNSDWLRFSACNGNTPDLVGNNVSFDSGNKKNIGVTYILNGWNKLTVSVTKEGEITVSVNNVEVYSTTSTGYIDGYVGLYTYLAGTKFRNFELVTNEDDTEDDSSSVTMTDLDFGYGLRATADNVSVDYDSTTEGYDVTMPSNAKHVFLVSDKKSDGEGYTVSVEYQILSADANASIGIVLGAGKDTTTDVIDLTTAYKMLVYKNSDWLRFSTCDGATPDAVGTSVSFDSGNKKNIGVTYKNDGWNKLSVSVTKEGKVTATVNDVEVYSTTATGYIDGYIGLYTYLTGTKFRNLELVSLESDDDSIIDSTDPNEFKYGYALRATEEQISIDYDANTKIYGIGMPSNAKHAFLVSDKYSDNKSYSLSFEYQISATDNNASIGVILGANRDATLNTVDIQNAYKIIVSKNKDSIRFSSCDGTTPDSVGTTTSYDSGNINNVGVTYKENDWNKLTVTVNESGIIVLNINGVEVLRSTSVGYINGYVGVYTYLDGTKFRNYELKYVENEEIEKIPDSDGINLAALDLAYALRATKNDVIIEYDKATKAYKFVVGGNGSKHYFLMSDTSVEKGKAYRISLEYQMDLTDKNASVGLIFGAGKDTTTNSYNLKSAYKAVVQGNSDQLRISSCDGTTPELVGETVTFDSGARKNIGVTYIQNGWNKLTIEVYKNSIECYVNGEQVFQTTAVGNIGGYIGLYSYLTGSSFRNFNMEVIDQKAEIPAGFFYDLSSKATFSSIDVRNVATNAVYDSKEKNMVVSPVVGAEGNGSNYFATVFLGSNSSNYALPNENCVIEDYPILAMKVKLKNKNSESGLWRVITSSSEAAWKADSKVARWVTLGHPSYIVDDDWQIVYIDTSKINNKHLKNGAVWDQIQLSMIYANGTISSEKDQFTIEWIGAFANVDDIKTVDNKTQITGEYSANGMAIDTSLPGRLFYDFSKPSVVSRIWADKMGTSDASTAISYDAENKAMKVSVLPDGTNNGYARFYLGANIASLPALDVSCDEYPVVAMKIKLKNTNLKASGGWLAKADGEDTSWVDLKSATYRQTDEWQVIYIDTRYIAAAQREKLTGNHWTTISIRLVNNNKYDAKANYLNDEFLVAWAGVFKTVKEAREFGGEVVEETTAKFLYDFTKQGTEGLAENASDTIVEYDSDVGAMKVSIKPGTTSSPSTRFYLGQKNSIVEQGISCKEYPVIAMRVKLNNPNSIAGYWHYRSNKSMANSTGYRVLYDDVSANLQATYQKTTDWQTVVVNTAELSDLGFLDDGATWDSFSFRMLSANTKEFSVENDVFWVAWIAGFASEKEAYEFSGDVTDTHEYVSVVGDGLTYGLKASSDNAYPINLKTYLGSDFSVKSFHSLGATVQDNSENSYRKTAAYTRSVEWAPGIVVMMLGTNDINTSNWKDASQYRKELISLIESYSKLQSNPQIYLCTTPYIFDEIAPSSLSNTRVKEIVKVQKEVAKELGITLVDTYSFLEGKSEYYFNGVYLNDIGYPAMAKFIAERIQETYTPKVKDYVFKLNSADAIKEYISWSELDDTEVSFDSNTSTMLVKAVDAKSGEKSDGVLDSNVAGFQLKLSGVSTDKYPVVAVKLKLGRKTAKAGWYGFDTTSTIDVKSAQRPIYEATTDWQTVIIDYSNPENNTMIGDFSGNWEALSMNLGVDNLSNVGDTYNVEWIGLFSSVEEAENYINPKKPADVQKDDTESSNATIIIVISAISALIIALAVMIVIFIKKRRNSK